MIRLVARLAFTVAAIAIAAPVFAQEGRYYDCGLGMTVATYPDEARAQFDIPQIGNFSLRYGNDRLYASEQLQLQFSDDGERGTLRLASEQFNCVVAGSGRSPSRAAYNPPSSAVTALNVRGQSLGGNIRRGPGTEYARVTSLWEGSFFTIPGNSGVSMNGYDWFSIRMDEGTQAYMWGGIMCSFDTAIPGVLRACDPLPDSLAPVVQTPAAPTGAGGVISFASWKAFAVDTRGAWGHGVGADRAQAEQAALRFCGNANCMIDIVTTANCQTMAVSPGSTWYGEGVTASESDSMALMSCSAENDATCQLVHTYCQ